MSLKNIVENTIISLLVFIVGASVGGYIGYKASLSASELVLNNQKDLIEQAIKKETNHIENTVKTEIDKIKNKKGEPINIVIDPANKSIISDNDSAEITVEEKKGFFKRLFNR